MFQEKGRPWYKRPKEADLKVVGHNTFMLLDWQAHMNVEVVVSILCILYLFSYVFKGNKKVIACAAGHTPETTPFASDAPTGTNEVEIYVNGRLLCANDAIGRGLGYPTYPASSPNCKSISVKTQSQAKFYATDNKSTDIQVYFTALTIHPALRHYTMEKFYRDYHAEYKAPTASMIARGEGFSYEITLEGAKKRQWVVKYVRDQDHIVRLEMLYPSMGDIWYLRLILRNRPVVDWEDAMSWPPKGQDNSRVYVSYQQAAFASNYLVGGLYDEAKICFDEAVTTQNPGELLNLLATLTLQGFVTANILHDTECQFHLYGGYLATLSQAAKFRKLLNDLKRRLATEMKTLEDFGFHINPATGEEYVLDNITELQEMRELYPVPEQQAIYAKMEQDFPNNAEQQAAFDGIMAAVAKAEITQTQQFCCIHGAGGTGKTVLAAKIAAKVRSDGKLVAICAATTLAATNYPGAHTAHSLFGYPVVEDDDDLDGDNVIECQLHMPKYEDRREYLQQVAIVFIDEAFSLHSKLMEAAKRAMADHKTLVWVIVGDTRQILTVIEGGTAKDIIGATFTSSIMWPNFQVFFLIENKRLTQLAGAITDESSSEERAFATGQAKYAAMLLQLGDNRDIVKNSSDVEKTGEVVDDCSHEVCIALPNIGHFTTAQNKEALDWLHPVVQVEIQHHPINEPPLPPKYTRPSLGNDQAMKNRAILATKNDRVDQWNTIMQNLNPHPAKTLLSHDYFAAVDDPHGHLAGMLTEQALNSYTNNHVPDHKLILKVDDVCFITRPMKASGLASNTRVRIRHIGDKLITVRSLDDNRLVFVPRMRFKLALRETSSFEMTRVAFPLRLCYAMSVNKSQGQSFEQVLLDFTDDAFAHGHTYVGFSRARYFNQVKLIVRQDMILKRHYPDDNTLEDFSERDVPQVWNTVYPSVIKRPPV